jgi:hypothetical protein
MANGAISLPLHDPYTDALADREAFDSTSDGDGDRKRMRVRKRTIHVIKEAKKKTKPKVTRETKPLLVDESTTAAIKFWEDAPHVVLYIDDYNIMVPKRTPNPKHGEE